MYTLIIYTWSFDSISYLMRFGSCGTKVTVSNPRKTEFLNLYCYRKNVEYSIEVRRIFTYYYWNIYHYDINYNWHHGICSVIKAFDLILTSNACKNKHLFKSIFNYFLMQEKYYKRKENNCILIIIPLN